MLLILHIGLLVLLSSLGDSVLAQERSPSSCLGQAQDRYWQDASTILAGDPTIERLSKYRKEICRQVAHGELELDLARGLWERVLVDAVVVQAALQKERVRRTVLRIYGTF